MRAVELVDQIVRMIANLGNVEVKFRDREGDEINIHDLTVLEERRGDEYILLY